MLIWALPVSADPVVITSGVYSVHGSDPSFFDFAGNGFELHGDGTAEGVGPVMTCAVCSPGTTIDLGASITLPNTSFLLFPSGAVIGRASYSNVFYSGNLLFTAPTVVAPQVGGGDATFTDPFTFSGILTGFPSAARDTAPLFGVAVTGTGTVDLRISENGLGGYDYGVADYTFSSTDPSATPEPSPALLLGTGLLALIFARRICLSWVRPRRRDASG